MHPFNTHATWRVAKLTATWRVALTRGVKGYPLVVETERAPSHLSYYQAVGDGARSVST